MTTVALQEPQLPEPLRTALRGAARLMAKRSEGPSGKGTTRYDYHSVITSNRPTVYTALRYWMEEETDQTRTLRPASQDLFAEVPESVLMLLVRCDASRPEGQVTELEAGDQLYALCAPEGRMLAVEVSKQSQARS